MGTTAVPGSVGEDIGTRQSRWTAAGHIAERCGLQRFVVVLAPFEVINRLVSIATCVVAVRISCTRQSGTGRGIVSIWIPVQAFASPVVDSVNRLSWSRGCG